MPARTTPDGASTNFLVSDRLRPAIEAAPIYHEIYGSDHCPVGLELKEELL